MEATTFKRGDKKLITRWAMYDWANSVYSLVITSAVFPIYYNSVTPEHVNFAGRSYLRGALYSYSLSVAFLIVALISPLLSPIADYRRNKLGFMQGFCYLGAVSCAALYFYGGKNGYNGIIPFILNGSNSIYLGIIPFILAGIGFCGSLVYYNAFLPEIAEESDQDRASAQGFALGYIGSVLLLIVNLLMIMQPGWFGMAPNTSLPARLSFLTVGVWWVLFAQITFSALRKFQRSHNATLKPQDKSLSSILGGYSELRKVLRQLRMNDLKRLRYFLFAFFFYSMALQTVMYIATLFGTDSLKLGSTQLIITILIIQLVAIVGSYLFSYLSKLLGNIVALRIAVLIWIGICLGAYIVFTYIAKDQTSKADYFYLIAFCVGMVMGGTQSLSRSTYSKLLPETEDHASFFSFYDVSEKIAIVVGTVSYGVIYELTGNMLNSILAFTLFFALGIIGLFGVNNKTKMND